MAITHLTDLHTHYDESVYGSRRQQILLEQHAAGVCGIVNSGSDIPSSRRSVELASKYDFIWASVGVFPLSAYTVPGGWLDAIRKLAQQPRVVAIGEIGLDYRLPETDAEKQKAVFHPQLELARELGLPVVIHDCLADEDVLAALQNCPVPAMIHRFFSGLSYGRKFVEMGVHLGIGPAITYPDAGELIALVKEMPIELLLLETDCPFLPTLRFEGKPATSDMLEDVVKTIALARGDITPQEVAEVAKQNAERFLSIQF